ncbi:hypothetical protein [Neobacillus mesonae]|uniref:hypothetical protein n=1 Tax=Neobacillus mesonae TaxID=1193713 RepID=UPI00203F6E15|nr:hypothetical protein [Neobacillus mesonae]MCM3567699.1 hypothetical protein [Neobacillus mesonae]
MKNKKAVNGVEKFLIIISVPIVMLHLSIFYFWIFDWKKLMTEVGLIGWAGSILIGIIFYSIARNMSITPRSLLVSKGIVLGTTFMTILLALFTLIIEFITSSMP